MSYLGPSEPVQPLGLEVAALRGWMVVGLAAPAAATDGSSAAMLKQMHWASNGQTRSRMRQETLTPPNA